MKKERDANGCFVAIGTDEPMGKKSYYFRIPQSYQEKLDSLGREERIKLIRRGVVKELEKIEEIKEAGVL